MSDPGDHRYLHYSDGEVRRTEDPAEMRISPKDIAASLDEADGPMALTFREIETAAVFDDRPSKAKDIIAEVYNRQLLDIGDTAPLTPDQVGTVWFSKTLQNWKGIFITDRSDGRIYELTHNGDKAETYVDTYVKIRNEVVRDSDR